MRRRCRDAWRADDPAERDRAAAALADEAAAANDHTSGLWWQALGHLPFVGDDAEGVAAIARSLDVIARDAVTPLGQTVDGLDGVVAGGRIDLDTLADLEDPIEQAHRALVVADRDLAGLDSDGYLDALRPRFDRFADQVHDLRTGLASAETAVKVIPAMTGADGPRNYLLIFQNNAEIRATGGMPGSWALMQAEDGTLEMTRQGTAGDFPVAVRPVLSLTDDERAVYGEKFGLSFQDAGWTADFPRAAELWRAHWDARFETPIDGVVAIDPVAISYLVEGTGPVKVGGVTLTTDNAVMELLSEPYIEKGAVAQDVFFRSATLAVFSAVSGSLAAPVAFVEGLNRAADEGRLLVYAFDRSVNDKLVGTRVGGELSGDDGATPHIDIGLDDLTGSKMSYYLRYSAAVDSVTCSDGVQQFAGALTMNQVVSPGTAAALPESVTGSRKFGTELGSQYVMVRIYGPYGGSIEQVRVDGLTVEDLVVRELDRRPVASIDVVVSEDVVLTWQGSTGPGQTADGELRTTPSVVPGAHVRTFGSAC